jgi:3-ketosteroid 9alpha-monooxygenase subunit A
MHPMETTMLAHKIEAAPIAQRFARGWHCLGLAAEFKDGQPHRVDAFGTRLVVFQGEDGQLHVLDAWCPHMGGDLSRGKVVGNSVDCPFHGWRYGSDGKAVEIPYCKRVPPKAKVRQWHAQEQNRLLFVWHDPEGNAPIPEQAIPRYAACFSGNWSDITMSSWTINTNNRELVDNIADMAHFGVVHGAPTNYFGNLFEDHKATQLMVGTSERLSGDSQLTSRATYHGPACLFVEMVGAFDGVTIRSMLITCNTPIDTNSFRLHYGVLVERVPGLGEAENRAIAEQYVQQANAALLEDVAIWDNKVRIDNPVLCEGDGPIYQARRWYQQFYVDVAEIQPDMRERMEVKTLDLGLIEPPGLFHLE